MLSMVLLIPAGFGLAIWSSYRRTRSREGAFEPEGKRRWVPEEPLE